MPAPPTWLRKPYSTFADRPSCDQVRNVDHRWPAQDEREGVIVVRLRRRNRVTSRRLLARWLKPVAHLLLGSALITAVIALASLYSAIRDVTPAQTFRGGEVADVTIDPADKPIIYTSSDRSHSLDTDVKCEIVPAEGQSANRPALTEPSVRTKVNGWKARYNISVSRPGKYQVKCAGDDVLFGIAKPLSTPGYGAWFTTSVTLLLAWLLVSIATRFTPEDRRRSHRHASRMQGQRHEPEPHLRDHFNSLRGPIRANRRRRSRTDGNPWNPGAKWWYLFHGGDSTRSDSRGNGDDGSGAGGHDGGDGGGDAGGGGI